MTKRPLICMLLAAIVLGLPVASAAEEVGDEPASMERPWEMCLAELRKAARLLQDGRIDEADAVLEVASKSLPPPYSLYANWERQSIEVFRPRADSDLSYRDCERRAGQMLRLGECALALHWAREAAKIGGPNPYADRERIAWYLAVAGRYREAVADYEEARRNRREPIHDSLGRQARIAAIQAMIDEPDSIAAELKFLERHYIGIPNLSQTHHNLLVLERLGALLDREPPEGQRRLIYKAIRNSLDRIADKEGLAHWERRMLAEPWATGEDESLLIAQHADRAFRMEDYAEAERLWRRIVDEYPTSNQLGLAQFNVGYVLQGQGKHDAAIAEYEKLFPSPVDDLDPTGEVMEFFRNYRHRAASQISQCYEAKGDFARALEWALTARDKYPYRSGCGTCMQQEADQTSNTLVRLLKLTGRTDEALSIAEALAFGEYRDVKLDTARFLVEEYLARGQAAELKARLEAHPQKPLDQPKSIHRKDDEYVDERADALQLLVDCLPILEASQRGDRRGLWRLTQELRVSVLAASFPQSREEIAANIAAERLIVDREAVIPLLQEKLRGGERARTWAIVLLARLGTVTNVEAVHTMLQRVTDGKTTHDRRSAQEYRQDYCFAILLADPDSPDSLVDRYREGPIQEAVQYVLRRSAGLPIDSTELVGVDSP
jgi:tetratricopeptide (TPR) repeat protein